MSAEHPGTVGFGAVHAHGEYLSVTVDGTEIARYVYEPTTPAIEARKPYIHPIRTLDGVVVSGFRPWDHPWHKGLQMTWSHVSDQNFWGGPSFRDGDYQWLDNVGQMRHDTFSSVEVGPEAVRVVERLTWITSSDQPWIEETRTLRFHSVDRALGTWSLDFGTTLTNVSGKPLSLGSPTTAGRDNAGYTGLFWRGPRSWAGGEVIAAGGAGREGLMGHRASWLAITGKHDEVDGGGTVLVFAGSSSAEVPITWFVRSGPFAAINPSPAFDRAIDFQPGTPLELRHRFVVANRIWTRRELDDYAQEHAL